MIMKIDLLLNARFTCYICYHFLIYHLPLTSGVSETVTEDGELEKDKLQQTRRINTSLNFDTKLVLVQLVG